MKVILKEKVNKLGNVGDIVEVSTPGGVKEVEILEIKLI